jgi:hypothetical protein
MALLPPIPHNLIETKAVDVRLDLDPDREMIGHLICELGPGVILSRKKGFDAGVVDVKVEPPL